MLVSPSNIALKRFLETTGIVFVSALLVVLPLISASLQPCSSIPTPGQAAPVCGVPWGAIFNAFIVSIISGLVNSLTSFISAVHANSLVPQAVTINEPQGVGQTAIVTPVPASVPVNVVNPVPPGTGAPDAQTPDSHL